MLNIIKEIFGISRKQEVYVGLSQLRHSEKPIEKKPVVKKKNKELKLSDIMKGTTIE